MKATWVRWLAAISLARVLLAVVVPVMPEEAYHWNYARHLDWGYYDHPPMVAWGIALGRLILGDTPIGVRLLPLLFSMATAALLARLARRLYGERAAVWAVLLISLQPLTVLVGGAGFPDSPLLFFWTVALACAWRAMDSDRGVWWLAAGAALGAGMLSKYTACFIVPSVFVYLLLSKRDRKWLATPWPYLCGVVSLVVFGPVIWWNWTHDWASFKFQSVDRFKDANSFDPRSGVLYILGQWLGVLPFTLPLAVAALRRGFRSERPEERLLAWSWLPMVLFFFCLGWTRPIHALWPLPAYLGLTVAMAGEMESAEGGIARFYRSRLPWIAGAFAGLILTGALHATVTLPGLPPIPDIHGWNEAARRIDELRASLPESAFILAGGKKYTCTSQIAFRFPRRLDVYGKNLLGEHALQYDYWAQPMSLAGRDAIVVIEDGRGGLTEQLVALVRERFDSVEPAGELLVPMGRNPIRAAAPLKFLFFKAHGYRPVLPTARPS